MDRVPICFIEEVLLQLADTPRFMDRKYPSMWGEVADMKLAREKADLYIYLESKEQAYFCVDDDDGPVELDCIGQFVFVKIRVTDDRDDDFNTRELPEFHPLTEKNFKLLHNVIRKPFPSDLDLDFLTYPIHPLVQRLCMAIPRVAKLDLSSQGPLSMDTLTRSIERETLSHLSCYIDMHVTKEMLPVLLRFAAFEKMKKFQITISEDSPVSYKALCNEVISAVETRKRGCCVAVDPDYKYSSPYLVVMGGNVEVNESCRNRHIFVRIRE
uniref:Mini-chromosome maintenance complex-binding protein n=1 Tax=Steinernema glaseri TaxID=37863 RepID=A0A1I8ADV9_9BILA